MTLALTFQITTYALALWLGLYLLARDPRKPVLRLTGLGLIAYALGIGLNHLTVYALLPTLVNDLSGWLLFLPALCWFGAAVYLLPEAHRLREQLTGVALYGLPVLAILLLLLALNQSLVASAVYTIAVGIIACLMLVALLVVTWSFRMARRKRLWGVLLVIDLFLTLSISLLLFPLDFIPRDVAVLAVGLDLFLLGLAIALLDAFDEGETLLPDMLQSAIRSGFAALVFGGQIALMMGIMGGISLPMVLLLYTTIAAALILQIFSGGLQSAVDRLAFTQQLRQARADLRTAAEVLPRMNPEVDFAALDDEQFAKLTRRALSHMNDLGRLSASPLTHLPLIDSRLAMRGESASTLERAAELKAVLTESIVRLKPRGKGDYGTSDEWRHYNALYFPYVQGIKLLSRDGYVDDADGKAVLEWFRASVPERTLHNWQNAAARIIARDLRDQITAG
ncbi:MAG: hypothetical protein K8L97_32200 [Anaerolineae bacterium]|nr:hypothetical protein [Anaerolineae bacterium]